MRLLFATLLAVAFVVPATARNAAQSPSGLKVVDWNQIRAEHDRYRHTAFPDGDGFQSRNREQQWNARFDGHGFEIRPDQGNWRWGLELIGNRKASVTVNKNRVTYAWSQNLEEWFLNGARGVEHGFTIRQRSGPVELRLAVRGGLRAQGSGSAVRFVDNAGEAILTYSELQAWDANGRALPSHMEAKGAELRLSVDDQGARYPITIDPLVQQAYLKPAAVGTTQLEDHFGSAVSVSGDTVVVGAYGENSPSLGVNSTPAEGSGDAGAAYVFVRTSGGWIQQAYLKPTSVGTTQVGDQFGFSVAVSGDTVVVGANFEDSSSLGVNGTPNQSARDSGAAYVFVRSAGVWTQQAYLKPTAVGTTQVNDSFGYSVAVSGDTVVVGALREDSDTLGANSTPNDDTQDAGAAYVFVRNAGVWSQQAYLKPANVGTYQAVDGFGSSVAVSGDTVVVGASTEDSSSLGVNSAPNENAIDSGAAYVFVRTAGAWSQQAYLKPARVGTTQEGDAFGVSVAVSGDTVVVGANSEDSDSLGVNSTPNDNTFSSGAAYVFVRNAGVWSQQAYLKPASVGTTQAADGFGIAVAVSGDMLVVGANEEPSTTLGINSTPNESGIAAGAAYVFVRTAGLWIQQAYLKPANEGTTQGGDSLGLAVAVSVDTVVAGAPGESSASLGVNSTPNENARNAGAVYAFTGTGPVISEVIDGGSLRPEIAPSAWVTIKGTGLAPTTRIWVDSDFVQNRLPTALNGVSVTIDGKPAAVYYISPVQINVLAGALTHPGPVNVIVNTAEGTATFTATVKSQVPAWFMLDPENRKYVAAVNGDGSIVGKTGLYPSVPNFTKPLPAKTGRALIYGTGFGVTNPPVPEGTAFSGAFAIAGVSIKIGGAPVTVEFAGVVTPGLFQFNIVAPDLPAGDYLIEGTINGVATQVGAYITLGP